MKVKRTRDVLRKKDIPESMGTGFSKRESLQLTSVFRISCHSSYSGPTLTHLLRPCKII